MPDRTWCVWMIQTTDLLSGKQRQDLPAPKRGLQPAGESEAASRGPGFKWSKRG